MSQNIYDKKEFFDVYSELARSKKGLSGAPEWSSIVQILPKMENINVIDLGCGYGWFCRYAKENNVNNVVGLDLSERMLNKAREMTSDLSIIYQKEDLELLNLPAETSDLVYSSLTFHYIENLSRLLKTIYESLKCGGSLIFSSEHPIYSCTKHPHWLNDEDGQRLWPVNSYQMEGKRVTNWLGEDVVKYHRTIGTYLNMLIKEGFVISHVEEWGPTSKQINENPSLDEEKERPMIFIVSAHKI